MKIDDFSKLGKPLENLGRIGGLLKKLGNPQNSLNFVHIAGTNGKGSVLEFSSQAFIYAGLRVGQFTSPFNIVFEDRIRVNGANITSEKVDFYLSEIARKLDVNAAETFSQFEITFAVALLFFCDENCDLVFLEVGIGGLLDATNIIQNVICCAITSVSLDHTEILGNTLEKIAFQKAGIIKPNVTVVVPKNMAKNALEIIKNTANEKKSPLILSSAEKLRDFFIQNVNIKMFGSHQISNAATAFEVCLELQNRGFSLKNEDILNSFANVQVPSRIEIISTQDPLIILDGAHNSDGMYALTEALKHEFPNRLFTVIFGVMKSKNYRQIAEILTQIVEEVICVDDFSDAAANAEILCGLFKNAYCLPSQKALEHAKSRAKNILICGSLYLRNYIL